MRHGRIISIKNPTLRKLRNNLRRLFEQVIFFRRRILLDKIQEFYNNEGKNLTSNNEREIDRMYQEEKDLRLLLKYSICKCGMCGVNDTDMVYHAGWSEWWCLKCFKEEEEIIDPKNKFNKGVIVHENAEKPCHILRWCPYGVLVESLRLRNMYSKYTCLVFDHDCPVFYVSEQVSESSRKKPSANKKLKDNLKNCEAFNDQHVIVNKIEKPCHILGWCPYGSLDDEFYIRESNYKYGCKIYPHDCPVFYHAESLKEAI